MVDAIMGMQNFELQSAYSTALMKRSMTDAESQAISLINEMISSVPAPSSSASAWLKGVPLVGSSASRRSKWASRLRMPMRAALPCPRWFFLRADAASPL